MRSTCPLRLLLAVVGTSVFPTVLAQPDTTPDAASWGSKDAARPPLRGRQHRRHADRRPDARRRRRGLRRCTARAPLVRPRPPATVLGAVRHTERRTGCSRPPLVTSDGELGHFTADSLGALAHVSRRDSRPEDARARLGNQLIHIRGTVSVTALGPVLVRWDN